jgi:hypothetical protein
MAHFKSAGTRRKALAHLSPDQVKAARTPFGLAKLVQDKAVSERLVNRILLKVGGMSLQRPPREVTKRKPYTFKFGVPFTPADVTLLAQVAPRGFRNPSVKAKNWKSTSLLEAMVGLKPKFERSARGDRAAVTDAETRELALATQDIRNVADKYLSKAARARKAALPPLPEALTVDAIRVRHALARGDKEPAEALAA